VKPLKCPNCGAPVELEAGDPEVATRVACPFCGAAFLADGGSRPRSIRIDARGVGDAFRHLARAVIVGAVVVVAVIAVVVALVTREKPSVVPPARSRAATVPAPVQPRILQPSQLGGFAELGRRELDAAPPPGGFGALDGAAALPWALALAQQWAPDARPTRIDVTRMRPDGTVNAHDDASAEVQWRFQSPAKLAAFRERANLEADASGRFELFLFARAGRIWVQSIETSAAFLRTTEAAPPFPAIPPLTETLRIAGRAKELPQVPFYTGYLIHLQREGWVWYLSTLSGEPNIPRLRARDGRFYPYGG
jgi:hypothetical protein